jgi:NAD(P)H dehydrogenase (quinone)
VRFGNMAAPLKYFLDQTSGLWLRGGSSTGRCGVHSSQTMHGGQESTLLSMMTPLLHHGMIAGRAALHAARAAGHAQQWSPGASHVTSASTDGQLTAEESQLARALGRRVATLALALKATRREQA